MKMIVGLGNPESRFNNTPHNVGFAAVDLLCKRFNAAKTKVKKSGQICKIETDGAEVLLVKPLTYMNSSGSCVRALMKKYKISAHDIVVLYDDISVRAGEFKLKESGSAGSHNGMKSVAAEIGTTEFKRLRIGVGEPEEGQDLADYVLDKIPAGIMEKVLLGIERAAEEAVKLILNNAD